MAGPHPAVAAVRLAVRRALRGLPPRRAGAGRVLGRRRLAGPGRRAGLRGPAARAAGRRASPWITGCSRARPEQAAGSTAVLAGLGLDPVHAVRVTVARPGGAGYPGPEAAARAARYAALDAVARPAARPPSCSGTPSMTRPRPSCSGWPAAPAPARWPGWPRVSGRYLRPLLGSAARRPAAACAALALTPWEDPHNTDPGYARVRVRRALLPALEAQLGPGRRRGAGPDRRAAARRTPTRSTSWPPPRPRRLADGQPGLPAAALAALPPRSGPGCSGRPRWPPGARAGPSPHRHVAQLDALVTGWHGQRGVDLPGGVRCQRRYDRLIFAAAGPRPCTRGDRRAEWTRLTWEPISRRS